MGWILCAVLALAVIIYMRELIDIGVIVLLLVALERFNTLMGGLNWTECVILGALLSPVVIFFIREAQDTQSHL